MIARRLSPLAAALAVSALAAGPAAAQLDYAWTGLVSNSWANGNNFEQLNIFGSPTGSPPGPGQRVFFNSQSTGTVTTVLDNNFTIRGLVVTNVPGAAGANPVSIGPGTLNNGANNRLTLGDATFGGVGIDLSTATQDLTVTSLFTFGPPPTGQSQPLTVAGGRTLTLSNAVTDPGVPLQLNQASATTGYTGTVVLGGSNQFSGAGATVNLRNGLLSLTNGNSLNGVARLTLDPLTPVSGGLGTLQPTATLSVPGTTTVSSYPVTLRSTSSTLHSVFQSAGTGDTSFGGAFTLDSAGTAGVVELNAVGGAGSTLRLSGAVSGGFGGTLQLGGTATPVSNTGGGLLTGAVTLSGTTGTLRKQDAGLWTLGATNAATAWKNTTVANGVLRTTLGGALAAGAGLTLGEGSTAGVLDLFGTNQTVAGLATGTAISTDPATNRIGIGDVTGAGTFSSVLTYDRTAAQTFSGVIANSVGTSAANKTVSLTLLNGDLTLGSTNTYTGPTLISNAAVLQLAPVTVGSFNGTGSIAVSSSINLNASGSRLVVSALPGFSLTPGQTLRGVGTVTGGVTVPAGGAIRGGLPAGTAAVIPGATDSPTGQLTVSAGLVVQGGAAGGGGQYAVDLGGTSSSGATVSRVAVGGAVNFDVSAGPVVIPLVNDLALSNDVSYSFVIGTATGGYQRNGSSTTSYAYPSDFTLTTTRPNHLFFSNVSLTSSGSPATLTLTFTPVPEPATVGLLAVAGLGAVRLARRRIKAG